MEKIESYLHLKAKEVLSEWLIDNPGLIGLESIDEIKTEETFSTNGLIQFVPDLAVYKNGNLLAMVEIDAKHSIDHIKIWKMQMYFYWHNLSPLVIEISADMIMKQIKRPEYLLYMRFNDPNYKYR